MENDPDFVSRVIVGVVVAKTNRTLSVLLRVETKATAQDKILHSFQDGDMKPDRNGAGLTGFFVQIKLHEGL